LGTLQERGRVVLGAPAAARRVRAIALAVCVLGGAVSRPAKAQLGVDQIELVLAPGRLERSVGLFNVSNDGDKTVQATLTIEDWDRAENGDNRFYPVGTLPRSCRSMLRVFPMSIRLEPHQSQPVRVAVSDADSLRAECWSVVFVETTEPRTAAGHQVTYVLRTGVKVYLTPPGLTREGSVEAMEALPHISEPGTTGPDTVKRDIAVTFVNTGTLHLSTRGTIEIRRPDNSLAAKVEVPEFPVLPGARRRVRAGLPNLPPGHYVALALLDFGGAEIAAAQIEYEER
jgi:P pilus assembly chaperone PapD